jgi:hypothetical protein
MADGSSGAMLLERCQPGTALRAASEYEQDVVIAELLRRLGWRAASAGPVPAALGDDCTLDSGSGCPGQILVRPSCRIRRPGALSRSLPRKLSLATLLLIICGTMPNPRLCRI